MPTKEKSVPKNLSSLPRSGGTPSLTDLGTKHVPAGLTSLDPPKVKGAGLSELGENKLTALTPPASVPGQKDLTSLEIPDGHARLTSLDVEFGNLASLEPDEKMLKSLAQLTSLDILSAKIGDPRTANMKLTQLTLTDGSLAYLTDLNRHAIEPSKIAKSKTGTLRSFRTEEEEILYAQITSFDLRASGSRLGGPILSMLKRNPERAEYVAFALQTAQQKGLDPYLFTNQLYRESGFNPNATSPVGAKGIGQFMPEHIGNYGLNSRSDFTDPFKSIAAAGCYMQELTQKHGGSQFLAMIEYNGGGGSFPWVKRSLGVSELTAGQWLGFMELERAKKGIEEASAWRVETYNYVTDIAKWSGINPKTQERLQTLGLADQAPVSDRSLQPR